MAKILIFLANGFEEVEGLTVVDLLRRADLDIDMVSMEKDLMVTGSHGVSFQADCLFSQADFSDTDMLVLPGGMPGTKNLQVHEGLRSRIREFMYQGKMLAAICAAPMILGGMRVLEGKRATCYPGFEDQLIGAQFVTEPVVCDGNVITSRGAGTAIEFAASIISHYKGKEEAVKIMQSILYPVPQQ